MLAAVVFVCDTDTRVAALPHVALAIDAFLDSSVDQWTLERASKRGFLRLLDRLKQQESPLVSTSFREERCKAAIRIAVRDGNVASLHWWLTTYLPGEHQDLVLEYSIQHEQVDVLEYLWQQNGSLVQDWDWSKAVTCDKSAFAHWLHDHIAGVALALRTNEYSDFAFIKWAHVHRDKYASNYMAVAISNAVLSGNLNALLWIHDQTAARSCSSDLATAVQCGHLEIAKWLYGNYPEGHFCDPDHGCSCLEFVQWLGSDYKWIDERRRAAWIEESISVVVAQDKESAMENQALEVIQLLYLIRQGNGADENPILLGRKRVMDIAAGNGLLSIVQWLHHNTSETCTTAAMDLAAAGNHLDLIQWLHLNRHEGSTASAMDEAAANGHLKMVQWLHRNRSEGCTTKAMDRAAFRGHLGMLQWLHESRTEGCTTDAMDEAARMGHLEIVQWLHSNRQEGCTQNAMRYAAIFGYVSVLKWLNENRSEGCTTDTMDSAAEAGRLVSLQYLHAHCPQARYTRKALKSAAKYGQLRVVEWLFSINPLETVTMAILLGAATKGHLRVVRTLMLHCELTSAERDTLIAKVASCDQFAVWEWLIKSSKE